MELERPGQRYYGKGGQNCAYQNKAICVGSGMINGVMQEIATRRKEYDCQANAEVFVHSHASPSSPSVEEISDTVRVESPFALEVHEFVFH
jgi:hypothetical protein